MTHRTLSLRTCFPLLQTPAPVGCHLSRRAQNTYFGMYEVGEEGHSGCVCPKTYLRSFALNSDHPCPSPELRTCDLKSSSRAGQAVAIVNHDLGQDLSFLDLFSFSVR